MFVYQTKSLTGKRDTNEDKHDVLINYDSSDPNRVPMNFYGVYDGHGGSKVSSYIQPRLTKYFSKKKYGFDPYVHDNESIKLMYNALQENVSKYVSNCNTCGSTALSVLQYGRNLPSHLKVINVGDCRCVLCNKDNIGIQLTKDHKPFEYEEKKRLLALNANLTVDSYDIPRIDNGLSVSRAFGDNDSRPFITSEPEIFDYELAVENEKIADKFLILACDGLWDVLSCQEVVNFILTKMDEIPNILTCDGCGKNNIALMLGKYAIEKGSEDNVSIVIVFFDTRGK